MKNQTNYLMDDQSIFLRTFDRCKLYWPLFITFLLLMVLGSVIYLNITPSSYIAKATLIIKDEKKGNEDSKFMEAINIVSTKKIIENEVEVIQSRPIIMDAINSLSMYAPSYRVKNGFFHEIDYQSSPIKIELKNPESIISNSRFINYDYNNFKNTITIDDKFIYKTNQWVHTPYGVLKFIVKPNVNHYSGNTNQLCFKLLTSESITKKIYAHLKIAPVNKLSSVIDLQYSDTDPKLAEDFLNSVINGYNKKIMNERMSLAKNSLTFIDKRLQLVGNDLDSIERKIRKFKGNSQAVDISTQGQIYLQNVSVNDRSLSEIDTKLSVVNDIEQNIKNNRANSYVSPTSLGITDPTITQLINNLNNLENDYIKLKKTVADNNPIIMSVNDQIESTKFKIVENLNTYKLSLEKSKINLLNANHFYSNELKNIPIKEQSLLEISRDKSIKSDVYAFLLQKREESEIAYASTLTDNFIISNAHSSREPESSNKFIVLGSFLFAIIGIPMSVVTTRDRFDNTVRFRKDIEHGTVYPIVGEVEQTKLLHKHLPYSYTGSPNYEQFRKIRYNLSSSRGIGQKKKKLLITSGISGEGKSYVATHLAFNYADAGKKVVVLDMDFRNPTLSKFMGFINEFGVSDYLSDKANISDIIHLVEDHVNLSFIPAGQLLDYPSQILENGKFQYILEYLEQNFDLIIFDSSPVAYVADAYLLSEMTDTTLFVVKHGYSPKNVIQHFDMNYSTSDLKDVVIVYNGVRSNKMYNNTLNTSAAYHAAYDVTEDRIKLLA